MKAIFAAGCFWGVEDAFKKAGVDTTVGYTGGHTENPTYEEVCSGKTGHAESVLVEYDPKKISYEELLGIFWNCHNPTHVNRQGVDVGSQYRSVIFYLNEEQKKAAEKSKVELEKSGKYDKPIATSIEPAKEFYPAEDYHQDYYDKNDVRIC